ncbi:MAG: MFS transporter [Pseudomonadota bacterium]
MPSQQAIKQSETAEARPAADLSNWQVFAIASGGTFLVSLDSTIVIATFPELRTSFDGATPVTLSWVLNAYTIIYAALLIPFGRLADLIGPHKLFLWGVGLFVLASLACGLANGPGTLIAARGVQAVGGALLTPASLTLILAAFPSGKRAAVVGLWSAVGALAAALGPGLGGSLVELAGWRAAFLVNIPIGIALLAFGKRLHNTGGTDRAARPDIPGTVLLIVAFGALTFGIVSTDDMGWTSAAVLSWLAVGVAAALLYLLWARGRPDATIDLTLFRDRAFAFATLAALVFGAAFSMLFLGYFLFLIAVWGLSEAVTGLAVMLGPLVVIPVAIVGGKIAAQIGHRPLLLLGAAGFTATQIVLLLTATQTPSLWAYWLPLQVLGGVSVGLLLPGLSGASVAHLPAKRFGVGGAVHNALRQFGGVIGTAVTVVIVGQVGADLEAFRTLFTVLAGMGVLTGLLCLPINTRPAS